MDFVLNGGNLITARIGNYPTAFYGDVNLTFNKALAATNNNKGVYLAETASTFNGNALHLIYNNSSKNSTATYSGDLYPTVESVAALGGVFYEMVVESNDFGLTLSATETAGTYKVNYTGDLGKFYPVVYDTNGALVADAVYDAEAKTLTVPGAGNYTVKVGRVDPLVSEIDFATGDKWTLGFYTGVEATEEVPYIMSFDYYLPAGSGAISSSNVGAHATMFEGSMTFKPGHHTITTKWYTKTTSKYFVPQLICSDTNTKLYIWNFSVTVGGAAGKNNGTISATWRTATFTSDTYLYEYTWYPTMDDSIPMSMSIVTQPNKTEYEIGESLDTTGLTLSVTDNYDVASNVTDGFTTSGFDSATAGEKTITVTYKGLTATFTVTVNAQIVPTGVTINTMPSKTVYTIGDTLDTAGLKIDLVYSDSSTETITEGYTVSGFDSATAGEKTVTVTYEGFTTTFTVTVEALVPEANDVIYKFDFSSITASKLARTSSNMMGNNTGGAVYSDARGRPRDTRRAY